MRDEGGRVCVSGSTRPCTRFKSIQLCRDTHGDAQYVIGFYRARQSAVSRRFRAISYPASCVFRVCFVTISCDLHTCILEGAVAYISSRQALATRAPARLLWAMSHVREFAVEY